MTKRTGTTRPASDPNVAAFKVVERLTGPPEDCEQPEKNPAAVALGRLGGLKGGKARAKNLTPEQLAEIGRKGAQARWGHKDEA